MEKRKADPDQLADINYLHEVLRTRKVIDRDYVESYTLDFNGGIFTEAETSDYMLRLIQVVKDTLGDRLPKLLKYFLDTKTESIDRVASITFLPRRVDDFKDLQREAKIEALFEQQQRLGLHDHILEKEYAGYLDRSRRSYIECSDRAFIEEFEWNQKELESVEKMTDNRNYRSLLAKVGRTPHNMLGVSAIKTD